MHPKPTRARVSHGTTQHSKASKASNGSKPSMPCVCTVCAYECVEGEGQQYRYIASLAGLSPSIRPSFPIGDAPRSQELQKNTDTAHVIPFLSSHFWSSFFLLELEESFRELSIARCWVGERGEGWRGGGVEGQSAGTYAIGRN